MATILKKRKMAAAIVVLAAIAEEEESKRKIRLQRRWYVRPINELRPTHGTLAMLINDMHSLNDVEWKREYFRMSDDSFNKLLSLVRPYLLKKPTHRDPIRPEGRLVFTIYLLATGHLIPSTHKEYRYGKTTAYQIFHETCEAIWEALKDEYMKIPDANGWAEIATKFNDRWNFPGCLGAVDGKHIVLQKPNNAGSRYYNYKKEHSLILMAVVDADYCFSYIDVGAYGRESDGGVFSRSQFNRALYDSNNPLNLPGQLTLPGTNLKSNHVFIGDDAFRTSHRMLKPYASNQLSKSHRTYNYRLSRARRIVENAFGILSTKWRIFRRPIAYKPSNVVNMVKAACVLHNFIRRSENEDQYLPNGYVDSDGGVADGQWRREHLAPSILGDINSKSASLEKQGKIGLALREQLREYFVSEAGAVPWQDAMI